VTILRVGSTPGYANNFDKAFGAGKKKSASKKTTAKKKTTKKKSSKK